jgi:hypothetical protein
VINETTAVAHCVFETHQVNAISQLRLKHTLPNMRHVIIFPGAEFLIFDEGF